MTSISTAQGAGGARHQFAQFGVAAGFLHFREHGHESGGKRALGEQTPQEVGTLKATQKASVMALVPNVVVTTKSRTSPRTRETMVMLLNDSRPRNNLGELTQRPS